MNCVLNVLKPPAMTSSDVVSYIRRLLAEKRVGHTGTLDPGAAGVLPICVGRATKLSDYLMSGQKQYIAEITFGKSTDTLDSYGEVQSTDFVCITREKLLNVLPHFLGKIKQAPPMYSAIKHEGKKLYELARQGVEVKKPPREVEIFDIVVLSGKENRFLLRVDCSKGTYIRSLVKDIANELGTCAYLSFLLRTQTGGYSIDKAYTLDEIQQMALGGQIDQAAVSMEQALSFMPEIRFEDYLFPILISGTPVDLLRTKHPLEEDVFYAAYCKGRLIGIGKRMQDTFKLTTMLYMENQGGTL